MNIQSSFDYKLKILVIGDSGVGKTNFLFRFVENKFNQIYSSTIGIDSKSKIIILPKNKQKIKVHFWDTCGQEKYRSVNKLLFQKVQGIILMYDITKRETYEGLNSWIDFIYDTIDHVPIVLVGNKVDDEEENRIVRTEEGKAFAKDNGFIFYETSALNGKNVNNAVYSLCEKIISPLEESFNFNESVSLNQYLDEKSLKAYKLKNERCC